MNQRIIKQSILLLRICIAALVFALLSLFLLSFRINKISDEFFKQLGISKTEAETKITSSLLSGSLDYYGIRNIRQILVNDRAAIVKDIAGYAKQYVQSDAFKAAYLNLRNSNKPAPSQKLETPQELQDNLVANARDNVRKIELELAKADKDMKKIFEQLLTEAKQGVKEVEDPENDMIKAYAENYELMKEMAQQVNQEKLNAWELEYPVDHLQYAKKSLQQFLDATADVDFNAQLTDRNGKKVFVNPEYERKNDRWKLAFRAGKDAVEAGRAFAKQWMAEIK